MLHSEIQCRLAAAGIVSLLKVAAISGQTPQRASTPNDTLKSPEVLADGHVVFRIYAPKASEVTLTGDWIDRGAAPLSLTRDEKGIWSATAGPLSPDIYSYSFTVDGVRTLDPKNTWLKPAINPPDMQFEVHGAAIAFADPMDVPHGETREVWYRSNSLKLQRRMHIYTPPGYSTASQAYPVLYLLHGGGDDDSGWTAVGRLNFILDNLIAAGKAKPMIVVMPDGFVRDAAGELPPLADRLLTAKTAPPLEKDLLNDIIPLVEKNYRVSPGSANRALAGLAVGGAQTLWIAPLHPDLFAYVGVFSSGFDPARDPDFETRNAAFLKNADKTNAQIKAFWVVYGAIDINPITVKNLGAELDKFGIHHQLRESPGGHTWINWRRWLVGILPLLFRS